MPTPTPTSQDSGNKDHDERGLGSESYRRSTWEANKGIILILCSEAFGSGMAAVARLLQTDHNGMTTLQASRYGPSFPLVQFSRLLSDLISHEEMERKGEISNDAAAD
jgi:hypothetical protein